MKIIGLTMLAVFALVLLLLSLLGAVALIFLCYDTDGDVVERPRSEDLRKKDK